MLYVTAKWSGGHIKKCACVCRGSVYEDDERGPCKCMPQSTVIADRSRRNSVKRQLPAGELKLARAPHVYRESAAARCIRQRVIEWPLSCPDSREWRRFPAERSPKLGRLVWLRARSLVCGLSHTSSSDLSACLCKVGRTLSATWFANAKATTPALYGCVIA